MEIERIHSYTDPRFAQAVLHQHGAFLVDGAPCSIEITGLRQAIVTCPPDLPPQALDALLAEFRFYAEHITSFSDAAGRLLREYPPLALFPVEVEQLQPAQFFIDEEKLAAVRSFVRTGSDVVLPLCRGADGRWILCDGHTRLYCAAEEGISTVQGFEAKAGAYIPAFAAEAQRRGISRVQQMQLLSHAQYRAQWDTFCDKFFGR